MEGALVQGVFRPPNRLPTPDALGEGRPERNGSSVRLRTWSLLRDITVAGQ